MVQFGSVSIGKVPRVVATLSSLEAMARFTELTMRPCEIAEVRLDLIGARRDWTPLAKRIQESGTPLILTLRAQFEGGKWDGSDEERLEILVQGAPVVSAVDVELKSGLAIQLKQHPAFVSKPVIASFHDFEWTPPLAELADLASRALAEGDVAKISTMVRNEKDVETLGGLLARSWRGPVCIIGMGPRGETTRTDFPRAGSCLTYGYFETIAAPGQLPAEKLMAVFGKVGA